MTEFDILRTTAEAALEKETASEGEIMLARLVIAYGENHRDVNQKTLSSLRERCDALLGCFRSLSTLVTLIETTASGRDHYHRVSSEDIEAAKIALEKASNYS